MDSAPLNLAGHRRKRAGVHAAGEKDPERHVRDQVKRDRPSQLPRELGNGVLSPSARVIVFGSERERPVALSANLDTVPVGDGGLRGRLSISSCPPSGDIVAKYLVSLCF